jgi:hypothetical protein
MGLNCAEVNCPPDSGRHPTCNCNYGWEGSIAFNGAEYNGTCLDVRPEYLNATIRMDSPWRDDWLKVYGVGFSVAISNVLGVPVIAVQINSVEPFKLSTTRRALLMIQTNSTLPPTKTDGVVVHFSINLEPIRDSVSASTIARRFTASVSTGHLVQEFDLVDLDVTTIVITSQMDAQYPARLNWDEIMTSTDVNQSNGYANAANELRAALNAISQSSFSDEVKIQKLQDLIDQYSQFSNGVATNSNTSKDSVEGSTADELIKLLKEITNALDNQAATAATLDGIVITPKRWDTDASLPSTATSIASFVLEAKWYDTWGSFNFEALAAALATVVHGDDQSIIRLSISQIDTSSVRVYFQVDLKQVILYPELSIPQQLEILNAQLTTQLQFALTSHLVEFERVITFPVIQIPADFNFEDIVIPTATPTQQPNPQYFSGAFAIPAVDNGMTLNGIRAQVSVIRSVLSLSLGLDTPRITIVDIKPDLTIVFVVDLQGFDAEMVAELLLSQKQDILEMCERVFHITLPYLTISQPLIPLPPTFIPVPITEFPRESSADCDKDSLFSWCRFQGRCVQDFPSGTNYPCIPDWAALLPGSFVLVNSTNAGETLSIAQTDNEFFSLSTSTGLVCSFTITETPAVAAVSHCSPSLAGFARLRFIWLHERVTAVIGPHQGLYVSQPMSSPVGVNITTVSKCGDLASSGYEWCAPKNKCVQDWEGGDDGPCQRVMQGYVDGFGCDGSRGYTFCATKEMCVQDYVGGFEGPCPANPENGKLDNPVEICNAFDSEEIDCIRLYHSTLRNLPGSCKATLEIACAIVPSTFLPSQTVAEMCPEQCALAVDHVYHKVLQPSVRSRSDMFL